MWRQKAPVAESLSDSLWKVRTSVVPVPREPALTPRSKTGWQIADSTGAVVVSGLRTRSLAIRMLGTYVQDHELPLRVEDADGQPTGDRLG
jgi:hypothetical protein